VVGALQSPSIVSVSYQESNSASVDRDFRYRIITAVRASQ
jgi:hypothetical protein